MRSVHDSPPTDWLAQVERAYAVFGVRRFIPNIGSPDQKFEEALHPRDPGGEGGGRFIESPDANLPKPEPRAYLDERAETILNPPVAPEKPPRGAGFDQLPYQVNGWNPDNSKHQETYRNHIGEAYRKYVEAVSKRDVEPLTEEQFTANAAAKLRELYSNRTQMRVPEFALSRIIMENAVKSQFETNTTRGLLNREKRAKRGESFGIPADLDDTNREIFAFVQGDIGKRDRTNVYGALRLTMDPSVDERTTVTGEDTLGSNSVFLQPKPTLKDAPQEQVLLSASTMTLQRIGELAHTSNPSAAPSSYREAQIHGGLPLSDVSDIEISRGNLMLPGIQDVLTAQGPRAAVMEVLENSFKFTPEDLAKIPNLDSIIDASIAGSTTDIVPAVTSIINQILRSTGNKTTKFSIK